MLEFDLVTGKSKVKIYCGPHPLTEDNLRELISNSFLITPEDTIVAKVLNGIVKNIVENNIEEFKEAAKTGWYQLYKNEDGDIKVRAVDIFKRDDE